MIRITIKICILAIGISCLTPAWPTQAQEKSVTELRIITQAGGSLVLDLSKKRYSVMELTQLAASLQYQATLTIIVSPANALSATQCAQIAKGRPGQVVFWF